LSLDHNYAPAHFGLGLLYEREGAFVEATQAYSAGLQLDPDWRPGQIRLGVVQARMEEWSAALQTLQPVVQRGRFDQELLFHLGLAQAHLGQYQAALAIWEPLRLRQPDDEVLISNRIAALYHLGREHMECGDFNRAIDLWEEGLQECPDLTELQDCLVETLVRAGMTVLSRQTEIALGEEEHRRASHYLERALALQPDETRARYYLGFAALSAGDATAAINYLVPLVEEAPDDYRATYHLILALLANGESSRVLPLLDNIEAVADLYSAALPLVRGNVALLQENWSEAFDLYSDAF